MSGKVETRIERSYLAPEIRAAAGRYLVRSGNADMLPILGLADDPAAAERGQANPSLGVVRPGFCPICQNKLPGHGVCRRSNACREAALERGEPASPYLCPVHQIHLRWGKCAECPDGGAR